MASPRPTEPKRRLRLLLFTFLLFLGLPFFALLIRAYLQLEEQAYFHYRTQAEELAGRIDDRILALLEPEELRQFSDYQFFSVRDIPLQQAASRARRKEIRFSPLAVLPEESSIPGCQGYFQIDPTDRFMTPLLPDKSDAEMRQIGSRLGLSTDDLSQRIEARTELRAVLESNRMLPAAAQQSASAQRIANHKPSPPPQTISKKSMNQKSASAESQISQLPLDTRFWNDKSSKQQKSYQYAKGTPKKSKSGLKNQVRKQRKETISIPSYEQTGVYSLENYLRYNTQQQPQEAKSLQPPIRSFEGAIDPFQFSVFRDGNFAFFRKVWKDNQRYVQGFVASGASFLDSTVGAEFGKDTLSEISSLIVGHKDEVYRIYRAVPDHNITEEVVYPTPNPRQTADGSLLLYRTNLSAPLSDIELLFTVKRLPPGPGAPLILALAVSFVVVLLLGLYFIHRLGMEQIELAKKRSDFVSAVSHELKTPLTSIRMYGELLREGWVTDEKKLKTYYDFIFFESERLSRLIANVLQLSKISKSEIDLDLREYCPEELMNLLQSKIDTQVQAADFELDLVGDKEAPRIILDQDSFVQIIINLVDNAIKFSKDAETKKILLGYRLIRNKDRAQSVQFFVRDFGPGIDSKQLSSIFELFYRGESELTRSTPGTGIGLALVHQLAQAMHGEINVVNKEPGAEFSITFLADSA